MEVPKTSKRRTSKLWLAVNTVLGWIAVFYGIWTHQAAAVVVPMIGLITQYSAYVLVGHWDFKRILENTPEYLHTDVDGGSGMGFYPMDIHSREGD